MNKFYVCSYFLIQNNASLIQICSRSDPFYDISCLFGFHDFLTILLFVPKLNKSIILIFTQHYDKTIDDPTSKPQMIIDYNNKYCGMNVLD